MSENNGEADDIATKLIGFLVEGFKAKEGREPEEKEIEELLSELTEDRINAMLEGKEEAVVVEAVEEEDAALPKEEQDSGVEAPGDVVEKNTDDDVDSNEKAAKEENTLHTEKENISECATGNKRNASEPGSSEETFQWPKKQSIESVEESNESSGTKASVPVFSWPTINSSE